MPTTRPAFFVSAAEARFLSQKLPEGREEGNGQEGHQEPPPGRIIWNWGPGVEAKGAPSEGEGEHA